MYTSSVVSAAAAARKGRSFVRRLRTVCLAVVLGIGGMSLGAPSAMAALPAGTILKIAPGVVTCIAKLGTPPNNCTYGTNVPTGSYFAMDGNGDNKFEATEKTPLAPGPDGGVIMGQTQSASGSHSGPPNGSAKAGIDAPWSFFKNTGLDYTTVAPSVLTNNGAGVLTLNWKGWTVTWNGIAAIPMGGDKKDFPTPPAGYPTADSGTAVLTCSTSACANGDTFTLNSYAHVPTGDPSGFGGVFYAVHLVGTIAIPSPPVVTSSVGTVSPGAMAVGQGLSRPLMTKAQLVSAGVPSDPGVAAGTVCSGGCFDFKVTGVATGATAKIVLTLNAGIPKNAVFHEYDPTAKVWSTFDTSKGDSVASAPLTGGVCPAPGAAAYTSGLTTGNYCVELGIKDGGPNDMSSTAGVIAELGGAGTGVTPPAVMSSVGTMSPGDTAASQGLTKPLMTKAQLASAGVPSDPGVAAGTMCSGGCFDFKDTGVATGATAKIVLTLKAGIPKNAVFRKYNTTTSVWSTFDTSKGDSVASAPLTGGVCPAPEATAYTSGLTTGNYCVELGIKDGGPNDMSSAAGVIADPSGVGVLKSVTGTGGTTPPPVVTSSVGTVSPGDTAASQGLTKPLMTKAQLASAGVPSDPGVAAGTVCSGGCFDFKDTGVATGATAKIVLTLNAGIPKNAVFHEYDPTAKVWSTFDTSKGDSVASAPLTGGVCPASGATAYTSGLTTGNHCVELGIKDGGPNDMSSTAGVIAELGGAGTGVTPPAVMSSVGTMSPGAMAVGRGLSKPLMTKAQLASAGVPSDSGVVAGTMCSGGCFDFKDTGVATGATAKIVLTLNAGIPKNAVFRKYKTTTKAWSTFDTSKGDSVASAPLTGGVCPAPGATAYTSGLTTGNYCVELGIKDGGPNDMSSTVGVIADPSGVGVLPSVAGTGVTLPTGTILKIDPGVVSCLAGLGTPPNDCTYGTNVAKGSYFAMDMNGNGVFQATEKTPLAPGPDGGVIMGQTQSASGSHSGKPNGTERAGIDAPWSFFGNTGLDYTTVAPSVLTNDGAGHLTLNWTGWTVTWNAIPKIPMGGEKAEFPTPPAAYPTADNGTAALTCSTPACADGDTFTLDSYAHVPKGDPSGFGSVFYDVHLVGTIVIPPPPSVRSSVGTVSPGAMAVGRGLSKPLMTKAQLASAGVPSDSGVVAGTMCSGGCFDFKDTGVATGATAKIVLTLKAGIPKNAVFRKYKTTTKAWSTFDTSKGDSVASAPLTGGVCPAPGATAYTSGLTTGNYCVELGIKDGGPNDMSSTVGVIADPSGVGVLPSKSGIGVALPSGTGGCSISPTPVSAWRGGAWWLTGGLLGWLGFSRRRRTSRPS